MGEQVNKRMREGEGGGVRKVREEVKRGGEKEEVKKVSNLQVEVEVKKRKVRRVVE